MNTASGATACTGALRAIPAGSALLAVVGPTACGKSDWGIALCKALNGEVISADSRQIYAGLDIGTGKVEGHLDPARGRLVESLGHSFRVAPFVSQDVDHWLIDIAPPQQVVTAAQYQLLAYDVMADILRRGRKPVLVGGTGLYVHAVADGLLMPSVEPDPALRARLETWTAADLRLELLSMDARAGDVVDLSNPRRMVRAIEVARAQGSVENARSRVDVPFRTLMLAPRVPRTALLESIHRRLLSRIEQGLMEEVERLVAGGLSHDRLEDLGLEYRYVGRHLRGLTPRDEMVRALEHAIGRYARRQMTWFRKRGPVEWMESLDEALARAREWFCAESPPRLQDSKTHE